MNSQVEKYDEQIAPEEPELLNNSLKLLKKELKITFNIIAKHLNISKDMLSQITGIIPETKGDYSNNVVPFVPK